MDRNFILEIVARHLWPYELELLKEGKPVADMSHPLSIEFHSYNNSDKFANGFVFVYKKRWWFFAKFLYAFRFEEIHQYWASNLKNDFALN